MTRFRARSLVFSVFLVILCYTCQSAWGHQRSESFSRWQYEGQRLDVLFTVSEAEAQRYFSPDGYPSLQRRLAVYLANRVGPSEESGCEQSQAFGPTNANAGYLQFIATWTCPGIPPAIDIGSFFEFETEHSHLISIDFGDGFSQDLLDVDRQTWSTPHAKDQIAKPTRSAFVLFLAEGIRHILGGLDHIVFLVALLLVCWRGKELVWAITGFTVGHSCSLALAVLGIVRPEISAIEAAIGLTILLVVVERASNAMLSARAAALSTSILLLVLMGVIFVGASEWQLFLLSGMALFSYCYLMLARELNQYALFRLSITGLFGVIHGFGFAGAFLTIDLSMEQLALSLAGFNIGVEFGQLIVLALLVLASQARHVIPGKGQLISETLAATVGGLGTFWFVSRLLG
jgi:hypothetical protein